jgi:hypothetical protein
MISDHTAPATWVSKAAMSGATEKQSGGEFGSTDAVAGAQDAALQELWLSAEIAVEPCSLHRPTPSHLGSDTPDATRHGDENMARGRRSDVSNKSWVLAAQVPGLPRTKAQRTIEAEDMTAPTTRATPKTALDQRATSRHDTARSRCDLRHLQRPTPHHFRFNGSYLHALEPRRALV